MSEHTIAAPTSEAMQELGRRVAGMVHGGDVLLLSGPLGAGKTTFAQGFGAGLDITEPIVSPTFTIARELDGHFADGTPAHLVHVDAYRLGGSAYARGRTPSGVCWTSWNRWDWTKNLKTPARTRWCLWSGANKWPPPWHQNDLKPYRSTSRFLRCRIRWIRRRTHQQRHSYRRIRPSRQAMGRVRPAISHAPIDSSMYTL